MIDAQGRLFGRFNLIDLSVAMIAVAMLFGLLWVRAGHSPLDKVVLSEGPTDVTLTIRGARVQDPTVIKAGEKAFITIRNQPYAKVDVVKVDWVRRPYAYVGPGGKVQTMPDPVDPMATDLLVTIRDHGQATEDGIVLGGNKVKIGIPLELEGFSYRLTGTITAVRMAS